MVRQPTRSSRGARRRALTLVELVVSFTAGTVLLAGMTSAIVLATRALPENAGAADAVVNASDVLSRLSTELQQANWITENTASAVTFVVADRNGDGIPERIRYAWSGAGTALTRQYNGAPAVAVLDNVQQFALGYDTKSVIEQYPGLPIEGPETELERTPLLLLAGKDYTVDGSHWVGQYLQPYSYLMPAGAVRWRVTHVTFRARKKDATPHDTRVQIRTANADHTPTALILGEQIVSEALLSDVYQWQDVVFSNLLALNANQGACLVLEHDGSGGSAEIRYDDLFGSGRLSTSNGGSTWAVDPVGSMIYYAYGKVSMAGVPQCVVRQYATGVRITLQVPADTGARLDTAVPILSAPELLAAVWQLDFSTNPVTTDLTADGVADWVRRDGQAFNTSTLAGGVWQADATLDTRPLDNFTQITTMDVRFRNTSVGGNGAVFWINADWSGGMFAPIFAYLQLQADGTQTLSVFGKADASTPVPLVLIPGLPGGFIRLRLLIDPGYDSVNIKVNDTDVGTFAYPSFAQANSDRFATIMPAGSNAEFDSVSIRVGGSH